MRFTNHRIVASPTDLANFLTCRHKTALDLRVAFGLLEKPTWVDPLAAVLQQRGENHERRYVERLRGEGLAVLDLSEGGPDERLARTREALRARTVDVITQGALASDLWWGYPDILRRTDAGYEAVDTKLTRETRGGTVLQLCVYTDLLSELSDATPEHFEVVTPVAAERYRFNDYGAYYRQAKANFLKFLEAETAHALPSTYPEPVQHCDVCRWSNRCEKQRRKDDHLSIVHGLGRNHAKELGARDIDTVAALAAAPMPLAWVPSRGAKETYERLREQARLQVEQRDSGRPTYECLPIESGFGLSALPEPRPGDLFLDLEGDPFGRPDAGRVAGEGNREYLFGLARVDTDGTLAYIARWALTDADERTAFDATMADIMAALEADPFIHIFHYNHYEVTAFKRLAGRYATREADLDRLLRGKRFVDLYAVVRRALRAGVETYSIKDLEPFYGFAREVPLHQAGDQRRIVEIAIETGDVAALTTAVVTDVEGYNRDDVRSTAELRTWLESLRDDEIASGDAIERPTAPDDKPSTAVDEQAQRVAAVRARLLKDVPADAASRTPDQQARYLVAYLLDWHRREDKAEWWDYFRLRELPESDLLDEPKAVAGLMYVCNVECIKKSFLQRYSYPEQEIEIRPGETLKRQDGTKFAESVRIDRHARTIDMLVGPSKAAERPRALFAHDHVNAKVIEESLMLLGEQVAEAGGVQALPPGPAKSLLLRLPPDLKSGQFAAQGDNVVDYARLIVTELARTTLPIQGPPGAGKTYTGARMIEACIAAGLKVGVTANSHKVIRNLLNEVGGEDARVGHKCDPDDLDSAGTNIVTFNDNDQACIALASSSVNVLGGTAWLWSRPEFAASVDVLFVDEAGQVSLANVLGVARAAHSLVLLGDPQQLEQPSKGSHPDGLGASALQHILADAETMPADRGLFLPVTWRLAPSICAFTSELFYANQLTSKQGLENQAVIGTERFDGAGLWLIEVAHQGNRNASDAEATVVADIIERLLRPGSMWIDENGNWRQLTTDDLRVVTPFNAQVARVREALAARDGTFDAVPVGTVDKFQGQEAPVAVYSMATSHPDDAPKGMEFLYNLNRLNVATSRARCAAILVASPRLFEVDCQTPRRMRLASALARFREMARPG